MSTFLYSRPSDNLLLTATISVNTGTGDTEYPAANINDLYPDSPAKLTTQTGSWVADLGSAQAPELVAIIHHNLDAALEVRIQGHTSNAWGGPDVNQLFTIPARYTDSHPVNVWLDLATLIPVAATRTKRYWRLVVVGTNSAAVSIGEWRLESTKRTFGVRNIKKGSTRRLQIPSITHQTELRVRRSYDLGVTTRAVEVQLEATDTVRAEVDTWFRSARGGVYPFLIIPYETENDAWMVCFSETERPHIRRSTDLNEIAIAFEELSRGLYP